MPKSREAPPIIAATSCFLRPEGKPSWLSSGACAGSAGDITCSSCITFFFFIVHSLSAARQQGSMQYKHEASFLIQYSCL
jgi:hypothetical protein